MSVEQRWDPDRYARHARFVADLGEPLIALLAPRRGEDILDVGCGDGALTEKIATTGCRVVGIDASPEQVEAARRRGLDARVMDAQALDFDRAFDAAISNAALHWMPRTGAVLAGVHRALRPGGRFVGEAGAEGNVAAIRGALAESLASRGIDAASHDPWTFHSAQGFRVLLERAGFRVRSVEQFARPTPLPGDIGEWLRTFAGTFLDAVAPEQREAFLDEVRERLRPRLCAPGDQWVADYVRVRFVAGKE